MLAQRRGIEEDPAQASGRTGGTRWTGLGHPPTDHRIGPTEPINGAGSPTDAFVGDGNGPDPPGWVPDPPA
jgi:hypothetical protein